MCLFGEREGVGRARKSFAGHKSLESGERASKPGFVGGKIGRRRAPARVSHVVRTRRCESGARSGARSGRHAACKIVRFEGFRSDSRCSTKLALPCKILKSTSGPVAQW